MAKDTHTIKQYLTLSIDEDAEGEDGYTDEDDTNSSNDGDDVDDDEEDITEIMQESVLLYRY